MKNFILFILLISTTVYSQAAYFESVVGFSDSQVLEKSIVISCTANDKICVETCGNSHYCKVIESICEDCATIKNQTLYWAYVEKKKLFQIDEIYDIGAHKASLFFKNEKFISLTAHSFLNILTPENKQQLDIEFNNLCGPHSENTIILGTVSADSKLDQLVGIICHNEFGGTIRPLKLNPEYFEDFSQRRFWAEIEMRSNKDTSFVGGMK